MVLQKTPMVSKGTAGCRRIKGLRGQQQGQHIYVEVLEIETVEVVADRGYESREGIENCVLNGIVPNVAMKYDKKERLYSIDYEEEEITEQIRCSKSEDIRKCIKAGILPACYENPAIEVELQEKSEASCFLLSKS